MPSLKYNNKCSWTWSHWVCTCAHLSMYVYACAYIRAYVHACACEHDFFLGMCVHTCFGVCMHACMCVHVYILTCLIQSEICVNFTNRLFLFGKTCSICSYTLWLYNKNSYAPRIIKRGEKNCIIDKTFLLALYTFALKKTASMKREKQKLFSFFLKWRLTLLNWKQIIMCFACFQDGVHSTKCPLTLRW